LFVVGLAWVFVVDKPEDRLVGYIGEFVGFDYFALAFADWDIDNFERIVDLFVVDFALASVDFDMENFVPVDFDIEDFEQAGGDTVALDKVVEDN